MAPERKGQAALGTGDRVLARLERTGRGVYQGRTIRRLPPRVPNRFPRVRRLPSCLG